MLGMPKPRRLLGGALLTAAATTLTVKGILSSPIGAVIPADELQHSVGARVGAALGNSKTVLAQAQQRLVAAILPVPPTASVPATASNGPVAAAGPAAPDEAEAGAAGGAARHGPQRILREAALRHQLDPRLVLALSYWESGWDQSRVSQTGAVGLMQVEPATAQEAGPALLGRAVDITDPYDNADIGTAVLKADIDTFKDRAMGLAAYYQGPTSLRAYGMFPETRQYVQGILGLAARMTP
jgi:soluble lytic murein transglycosylase-like protein